ncbi:reverse transcriptase [Gossypium australe]|uniref:Reverse transcriptase n=1 Tax=Gossypium australe TaxID=47621 RepID=A0A5B6WUG5_9ROSI|nr:reverse transcriptase [Gossypium australe]
MNFIKGLRNSKRKDTVLVVVDQLTKYDHFVALSHPFLALIKAQAYLTHIYNLYATPESVVSDRDKFKRRGKNLHMSTAYHLKTDGQIEFLWLPLIEWWYNTIYHLAIQSIPYEALYRQESPHHLPYLVGSSLVDIVDRSLH